MPPQKHPLADEESSRTLPSQRLHSEAEGQQHSKQAVFAVVEELDGERRVGQQRVRLREVEVFEDEER